MTVRPWRRGSGSGSGGAAVAVPCSAHLTVPRAPSLCCSMSGLSRPGSCTSPEAAAPTTSAAASAVASSIAGRSSSAISSVAAHTIR
eukprot:2269649-Pleurochrysis_carterae.AAC.1